MIGLVNTVYVRSCLSLVNSFNSLSLVKHRRISSLSHPKHTLLSVRIRKMNTSLSKRRTVRKYGQIQTSGEYLFTDTEVNYQRQKKGDFIDQNSAGKVEYSLGRPFCFANQSIPHDIPSLSSQSGRVKMDIYWFRID